MRLLPSRRVQDDETKNGLTQAGREAGLAAMARYRWKPGQSGNPGGRGLASQSQQVLAKARHLASSSAIEAMAELVAIMRVSSDEKLRAWCAREILNQADKAPLQVIKAQRGGNMSPSLPGNAADLQAMFDRVGQEALHALDQGARTVEIELTERVATVRPLHSPELDIARSGSVRGEGVCLTGTPPGSQRTRSVSQKEANQKEAEDDKR